MTRAERTAILDEAIAAIEQEFVRPEEEGDVVTGREVMRRTKLDN